MFLKTKGTENQVLKNFEDAALKILKTWSSEEPKIIFFLLLMLQASEVWRKEDNGNIVHSTEKLYSTTYLYQFKLQKR